MEKKKTEIKRKNKINKKKRFIDNFISTTTTEKILLITFIVLLIAVIILSIKAIAAKKEYDKQNAIDLTIPILEKQTNNKFLVDISNMKKDEIKKYTFKITNYKDEKVSSTDLEYNIELTNDNKDVVVKLYKNKDDKNLLTGEDKTYKISNNKLLKIKKTEDTYYLIIRAKKGTEKKDNISIKINGIN